MPRLEDALAGVTRIGVDTMSVIYFVEESAQYLPLVRPLFQRVSNGQVTAVTSTITLLEVLVLPLRLGSPVIADQYRDLLTGSEGFEILPLTEAVAETAADLRARYNLRTADSVVAATAIQAGCQALVTNDERLQRVTELRILYLDIYLDDTAS